MSTLRGPKVPPAPPSRTSSLRASTNTQQISNLQRPYSVAGYSFGRLRSSVSLRPRTSFRYPTMSAISRDMNVRRWDGAARNFTKWDGLRRDPELWFPEGNCFIHLYGRGQSQRGPAFRVPFNALLATNCRPLLDRFMTEGFLESPVSDVSNGEYGGYFGQPTDRQVDLYIPAPASAEREQAFLYHTATRNFFAWMFGKSMVGTHLGGALVGLLNSMNEFRSVGEDNIQAILDYMDHEGYADMRNSPDHALGVLYFAEHFYFRDMWIDAFAHCCGMNDILITSIGFEQMTRQTRAFITRSRMEMDMRLEESGAKLSTFLSEELSESQLNLTSESRAHLDKFRTWLQSYYVAKLGYYPPRPPATGSSAFPSCIYRQMRSEFQKLYDFLVDTTLIPSDPLPISRQGGICILQNTKAFDQRYKFESLPYPFPLLPEMEDIPMVSKTGRRFGWRSKQDKMKPDERLVTFSALTKATNRKNEHLYDCSLVRAYRGFEKDCVFSPSKADKDEKLSPVEARKVRWLLIYSVLQTLNSATRVPPEVRDVLNVPYNLCVLTAGCPPWSGKRPIETLLRTQTDQAKQDYLQARAATEEEPELYDKFEIKPDIDYSTRIHRPEPLRLKGEKLPSTPSTSRKGTIRRALSSLGNMPELQHPSPRRASFHEILVHGYGNGTNAVVQSTPEEPTEAPTKRKLSTESTTSSDGPSSRWSNSSYGSNAPDEASDPVSPTSSISSHSRRPSDSSDYSVSKSSVNSFLDRPLCDFGLRRVSVSSSRYAESVHEPEPLSLEKHKPKDYDYYMTIITDVEVKYDNVATGKGKEVMRENETTTFIAA